MTQLRSRKADAPESFLTAEDTDVATAPEPNEPVAARPATGLGRATLVYGAGEVISKLASFLMLPIYTRFLTPQDYGVIELLAMTIELIALFAGVGLAASVFKFYADAEGEARQREVFSTAGISVLLIASITAGMGLIASPALGQLVFGRGGHALHFRIFFLIYLVQSAQTIPFLLLRARQKAVPFVTLSIVKLLAMLSLNVYFVVILRMGVLGVLISNLAVNTLLAAGMSHYFFRNVGFRFTSRMFESLVRFGFPVVFWMAANFVVVFSDRYVLNHTASTAAVGIYSLAYKLAFVLSALAFTPFQMMWDAQRFTIAKQPNAGQVYSRVFVYLNIGLGLVAAVIALFAKDVLRVIADPAFHGAYTVVPLLLAAQIIYSWTAYCNVGLFLTHKTRALAWLAGPVVVVVIALNLLLIPKYGIMGAAVATLTAYAIRFASIYYLSQRQYRIEYDWMSLVRLYAILGAAVAGRRVFVHDAQLHISLTVSALLVAAAGLLIYRQVLTGAERQSLMRLLRSPVHIFGGAPWRQRA